MEKNLVRASTFFVAQNARKVRINQEKIGKLARKFVADGFSIPKWPHEYHFETRDKRQMLTFLIILDSLNFCFWNRREKWNIKYQEKRYSGYFGLSSALKKYFEANLEKANFDYFSSMTYRDFLGMLGGGKNLLFLKKRWEILRKVSKVMTKKYNGDAEKFITQANHNALILSSKIAKELPSFDDVHIYDGKIVYIWKRAQILVADIWGAFYGRDFGFFKNMEELTAFADYKLPQLLHFFGILEYEPKLLNKIKENILIPSGSQEEIEIRACTIWTVEYLQIELRKLGREVYPFQCDWILWNMSQQVKMKYNHHLTRTYFY